MPPRPNQYLEARNTARSRKEEGDNSTDELIWLIVNGLPYFPNLTVPICSKDLNNNEAEMRNESIKKVVEHIIVLKGQEQQRERDTSTSGSSSSLLSTSSWTVTPVTGGNTNQLFCVSGINSTNNNDSNSSVNNVDSVLVRLFGADGMIDRDEETSTFASLAEQGFALRYYGRFGNGRVEEMLLSCDKYEWTTLTEGDLVTQSSISNEIARQLAKLHSTYKVPDKELKSCSRVGSDGPPQPTLWTQLYPWLERALEAEFQTVGDTKRATQNYYLNPPLTLLKQELDWLKLRVLNPKSAIGFCHNDLLASNIMMKTSIASIAIKGKEEKTNTKNISSTNLQFIDFEYGGINYYAYDIANHFNEYAGGTAVEDNSTPNYDRCPDADQKRAFFEAYVNEFNINNSVNNGANITKTLITVEKLSDQVDGFILANHLVWGLWGVLQAASEGCNDGLDYLHYAKCRFDRYRHDKRNLS